MMRCCWYDTYRLTVHMQFFWILFRTSGFLQGAGYWVCQSIPEKEDAAAGESSEITGGNDGSAGYGVQRIQCSNSLQPWSCQQRGKITLTGWPPREEPQFLPTIITRKMRENWYSLNVQIAENLKKERSSWFTQRGGIMTKIFNQDYFWMRHRDDSDDEKNPGNYMKVVVK